MADHVPTQRARGSTTPPTTNNGSRFLRKLHTHIGSNSSQLVGFLSLIISGSILLLFTGITIIGAVLGLIFFSPLIIVSSPKWFPIATVFFFVVAEFLSFCGFGLTFMAGMSWMYRYLRGLNPPGSDQVEYARNRLYDTASHVKDYARESGGYLQSKVKDAAPGA